MSRYGASTFSSLLDKCVLWAPLQHSAGVSGDIDEFPILPSGVTVTNNGTFTKTDLGNSKSVLNFDGSTNYISLTDNDAWTIFESDFTITTWMRLSTIPLTAVIINQYLNGQNYWSLIWTSVNTIRLFGLMNTSETKFNYTCPLTQVSGVWHHIVVQRLGSNCLMYVNGIPQSITIGKAFNGVMDISTPLNITYLNYTAGNLKDLMIYKGRALTQPEIKLLMNRTHPITGAGLMPANGDYWRTS